MTLKVWFGIEAGQRLAEDKRIGALELVLSTPLTVRDIIEGQWLALRRQFMAPVVAALVLEIYLMTNSLMLSHDARLEAGAIWLAGILFLPIDLTALFWVSMARALIARNFNVANSDALTRILALPWIGYGLVMMIDRLLREFWLQTTWNPDWRISLEWWVALGLAADIIFGVRARRQLLNDMRKFAAQRFTK